MAATTERTATAFLERTNEGHWLVESATTPGRVYRVEWLETPEGWTQVCSCAAAEHGRMCWHLRAAIRAERERDAAA